MFILKSKYKKAQYEIEELEAELDLSHVLFLKLKKQYIELVESKPAKKKVAAKKVAKKSM